MELSLEKSIAALGSENAVRDSYHFTTKTYSITKYMSQKNNELLRISRMEYCIWVLKQTSFNLKNEIGKYCAISYL